MRVALIAPPFIPIPPVNYGGTELFIAQLAAKLKARGQEVILYATGDSTAPVEVRSIYKKSEWPIRGEVHDSMKDVAHSAWALRDAMKDADVIHVNGAPAVAMSRFVSQPVVYTVHHPLERHLLELYAMHPAVHYVCISEAQRRQQKLKRSVTIHHGVEMPRYQLGSGKREHLSFLGRVAPVKGTHLAIAIAQKSGIPLKIAGEVQPMFKDYFETMVKPHIDGKFIEFVGEADLAAKNELLGKSIAMLFPIQWEEPFGLVLIEAMACGTPVLAMPGGSVAEIVREGVSGHVRASVDELAALAGNIKFDPAAIRQYVADNFSVDRMVDQYLTLYAELAAGRESQAEVA